MSSIAGSAPLPCHEVAVRSSHLPPPPPLPDPVLHHPKNRTRRPSLALSLPTWVFRSSPWRFPPQPPSPAASPAGSGSPLPQEPHQVTFLGTILANLGFQELAMAIPALVSSASTAAFSGLDSHPQSSLSPLLQGPRILSAGISAASSATRADPPSFLSSSPTFDPPSTTPPLTASSAPPTPSSSSHSPPIPNLATERSLPSSPPLPHSTSPSPSPPARMLQPIVASLPAATRHRSNVVQRDTLGSAWGRSRDK